ncbi:hypothetical protein K440DRAFT_285805 [Wilcoxina mikolae CBS 423.85]|nr:hypothetical protein K440DRAFT_285805 [Wilcoxina mikolae CBS 423.85]
MSLPDRSRVTQNSLACLLVGDVSTADMYVERNQFALGNPVLTYCTHTVHAHLSRKSYWYSVRVSSNLHTYALLSMLLPRRRLNWMRRGMFNWMDGWDLELFAIPRLVRCWGCSRLRAVSGEINRLCRSIAHRIGFLLLFPLSIMDRIILILGVSFLLHSSSNSHIHPPGLP